MVEPDVRDIWYVVKDPGGTAGVLPVRAETRKLGFSDYLFANGAAVKALEGKEEAISVEGASAVIAKYPLPKVLVTSMCSGGGAGRDLAILLRGRVPVIAGQDFWAARLRATQDEEQWSRPQSWPDAIWVNDPIGKSLVMQNWRGYDERRIWMTGYPAQDKLAGYDIAGNSAKAKMALGLTENWPIVLYTGQVRRSGEIFAELVAALNEIGQPVYLLPRQHPRMASDAPEEAPKWEAALAAFASGEIINASSFKDALPLMAAATVICSAFSTMLVDAAVLRKASIAILYPEVGLQRMREETGGALQEFPLVELGCASKASNRPTLRFLLEDAYAGKLAQRLRPNQERHFRADGKNATRVAERIAKVIRGVPATEV